MRGLSRLFFFLCTLIFVQNFSAAPTHAQVKLKKVRMGVPSMGISYLPLWVAYHKGFYRDEGLDLEIVLVAVPVANTAILTGDIDYHGGVAGLTGAAVRGAPVKALIFTGDRPLQFFMTRKEIKEPAQLKGKKIAGGPPGGTANLLAERAVKEFGLDPKRDVSLLPIGPADAARLAALQAGVVDAIIVGVPENILAIESGFRELAFIGDIIQFPQNGFGSSEKTIRENPDEVLKMVRATLRGLMFTMGKNNQEEVLDIITKQWKINNRRMAGEMFGYVSRFLAKDASVKPEEIQILIDIARENAKVSRQVAVGEVVDYSFVEKARKELGLTR